MKINDYFFRFATTQKDSICRIRTYINNKNVFVVITDLGIGGSVTNNIKSIRSQLIFQGLLFENAKIIEHYEKSNFRPQTFDLVTFKNDSPNWKRVEQCNLFKLIECSDREFDVKTFSNKKNIDKIEKIQHQIDPFFNEPDKEDYTIIKRREEIYKNRILKKDILELVNKGSKEQDIQKLIKKDLSLIADTYALPKEEYICFSEFPIEKGFVDFILFSGRSKMQVTLIEIKGANYKFLNTRGYKNFSAKTNEAIQQIRERLSYIHRNYEEFRKFVHKIRKDVENGKHKFNAFIGPKGEKLNVDEDKDIILHTIVIGGRSHDDILESRLKNDFERITSPSLKLETWDSWLNKIDR